jgi:hypothetical protein
MRKPKREVFERQLNLKDYLVSWNLNPGMRDIFEATNNVGGVARCSTREFYEDAHNTKSLKKIKIWQKSRADIMETTRNTPQKTTVSLETLERYVRFVVPRMDLLIDFRMQKPFRRLRFRRQIHAKKKIHALCSLLTEEAGERTIVGFGDWNIGGCIKLPESSSAATQERAPEALQGRAHRRIPYKQASFGMSRCSPSTVEPSQVQ